ncbi:MAG: alpha/beta fold hydrolase, partial [Myxococcales bacterium]|nr:alpha/beta fold hydrolase [Myxococcales bacterium]
MSRVVGGLAYRVEGSGPAALLLHPAFADSRAFDGEVAALVDRMTLVRVDLPGHGATRGRTDAPTMDAVADVLAAILEAEGLDRVDVLGVSLGSLVGQDFARRHPERVRSLTALGGYPVDDPTLARAQRWALLTLLAALVFTPARFRRRVAREATATPAGRARFEMLATGFGLGSFLAMRGMDQVVDGERTDVLGCPIQLLVGEHDLPLIHEANARWHAAVPGSRLEVLAGAGHCANL